MIASYNYEPSVCVVCLWDKASGRCLHRINLQGGGDAFFLTFSGDGKTILVAQRNRVTVFEVGTGKEIQGRETPEPSAIQCAAFLPDGDVITAERSFAGVQQGHVWNIAKGGIRRRLPGLTEIENSLGFFQDCKLFATAGGRERKTIHFWDVATGQFAKQFELDGDGFILAGPGPEGHKAVTIVGNKIRVREIESGILLFRQSPDDGGNYGVTFSPDGKLLVSVGGNGTIRVWDFNTGKELTRWQVPAHRFGPFASMAVSPDGKVLASMGTDDTAICLWDLSTGKEINPTMGHAGAVCRLQFSSDGNLILSYGLDRKVLEWDLTTGRPNGRLCGNALGRTAPGRYWLLSDLSPNGNILA